MDQSGHFSGCFFSFGITFAFLTTVFAFDSKIDLEKSSVMNVALTPSPRVVMF